MFHTALCSNAYFPVVKIQPGQKQRQSETEALMCVHQHMHSLDRLCLRSTLFVIFLLNTQQHQQFVSSICFVPFTPDADVGNIK